WSTACRSASALWSSWLLLWFNCAWVQLVGGDGSGLRRPTGCPATGQVKRPPISSAPSLGLLVLGVLPDELGRG
ncbi:MAG TPA: hypothetical protein VMF65_22295, partial [Acidimicrobiales bacterium]|nr:hypothetical protein [Acidimicrobiales bacterium]